MTNETIFAEAQTEVHGRLTSRGFANQRVAVKLLWETGVPGQASHMETVDTLQVETGADDQSVPVTLHYTPQAPGEFKVTLRVEPRKGELVTTNNEASTFVTAPKAA